MRSTPEMIPRLSTASWLHSVLKSEAVAWLNLGWRACALDYRPSVREPIVLIEWKHSGPPKQPERIADAE